MMLGGYYWMGWYYVIEGYYVIGGFCDRMFFLFDLGFEVREKIMERGGCVM